MAKFDLSVLPVPNIPGPYYQALITHGGYRAAARSLGLEKTPFTRFLRKELGLCLRPGCPSIPKEDRTLCDIHMTVAGQMTPSRKSYSKQYRSENQEHLKTTYKKWQKDNLSKIRAYNKEYRQTDNGQVLERRRAEKRRARAAGLEDVVLTFYDYILIKTDMPTCMKCHSKHELTIDHHIPLALGGQMRVGNAVRLCRSCNSSKRARAPETFYTVEELAQIQALLHKQTAFLRSSSPTEYVVETTPTRLAANFITANHYLGSAPVASSYALKLTYKERTVGAIMFSQPTDPRESKEHGSSVIELARLFVLDGTPKNTESYFIGYCLRWLKKNTNISKVISYADPAEGHSGVIYKASNFEYHGKGSSNYSYEDETGKRINKRKVYRDGKSVGLTEKEYADLTRLNKVKDIGKHKYVFNLRK